MFVFWPNPYSVGHFSSKTHFQVMACPIIRHSSDRKSPAPIIIYDPVYGPDTSVGPKSWTETIIFDTQFRLIHDMKIVPGSTNGLDVVLVAGREGIVLIYYDTSARKWEYNIVGAGLPQEQGTGNPYWGSGSVDVARVGDDSVGYIATCEVGVGLDTSSFCTDYRGLCCRPSMGIPSRCTSRKRVPKRDLNRSKIVLFGRESLSTTLALWTLCSSVELFTTSLLVTWSAATLMCSRLRVWVHVSYGLALWSFKSAETAMFLFSCYKTWVYFLRSTSEFNE